ncbi:hypothetical protein OTU49_002344, partial [Cherax quadricarinatus]
VVDSLVLVAAADPLEKKKTLSMGLFSKSPSKTPKDQVNEWCSRIRKEGYGLDRQIRAIQREEEKVKRSLKEAAKKGDQDVCRVLAKEIVQSRKAISRIYTSKAHLNSVQSQMKAQLGVVGDHCWAAGHGTSHGT